MNIIIGGGSGLVGKILVPELLQSGHNIYVIGRNADKIKHSCSDSVHAITWDKLHTLNPEEFTAIINLAGENIADKRWTAKTKERLLASRIETTKQLVLWGIKAKSKKPHLYNASAVSIYGLQKELAPNNAFTETSTPRDSPTISFSSQMVNQWEQAAQKGFAMDMPVTLMRFGVVLKRGEGMLKKLELPTKLGLGAVVGSGKQPLAWIDSTDLLRAIMFLLAHPEITGPVNMVAPESVSQKTFTKTLAHVLRKPALLHLPDWLTQILFGQMGKELLLSGQNVVPQRLSDYKFQFKYPTLLSALTKELGSKETL
jgi:hypothetical protein